MGVLEDMQAAMTAISERLDRIETKLVLEDMQAALTAITGRLDRIEAKLDELGASLPAGDLPPAPRAQTPSGRPCLESAVFVESFHAVSDVAERLSISERSVRYMIARGEIPSYKIAGRRRIDPSDLRRWLEQRRS